MDYLEIMNFCGYDLNKADKMAGEIVTAAEKADEKTEQEEKNNG
jgi:hypothetical protein